MSLISRTVDGDHFLSQRLKYIGTLMNQDIRVSLSLLLYENLSGLIAVIILSPYLDSRLQELYGGMKVILTKAGWPLGTIAEWQRRSEEGRIIAHSALRPVTELLLLPHYRVSQYGPFDANEV